MFVEASGTQLAMIQKHAHQNHATRRHHLTTNLPCRNKYLSPCLFIIKISLYFGQYLLNKGTNLFLTKSLNVLKGRQWRIKITEYGNITNDM